jgi:hypothetical protein
MDCADRVTDVAGVRLRQRCVAVLSNGAEVLGSLYLHEAIRRGHTEAVGLLVEHGARLYSSGPVTPSSSPSISVDGMQHS